MHKYEELNLRRRCKCNVMLEARLLTEKCAVKEFVCSCYTRLRFKYKQEEHEFGLSQIQTLEVFPSHKTMFTRVNIDAYDLEIFFLFSALWPPVLNSFREKN